MVTARPLAPVALFIFNRPDLTERVMERIRAAQPGQLFIIADAPRSEAERPLCDAARAVALNVDWECRVVTDFATENMRGPERFRSGMAWIFEQVEEVMVLEDDCVPTATFFSFCTELLDRYRENARVMHINGANYAGRSSSDGTSYYFTKYAGSWGWATWRRAWQHFDLYMQGWPAFKASTRFADVCPSWIERSFWANMFDRAWFEGDVHWDWAWQFACWQSDGVCIGPAVNMITNVGYRSDGTHSKDPNDKLALMKSFELPAIIHAPRIGVDARAEYAEFRSVYLGGGVSAILKQIARTGWAPIRRALRR